MCNICDIDFENPERGTMSLLMWGLLSLKNSGANSSMHSWLMMSILVDDLFFTTLSTSYVVMSSKGHACVLCLKDFISDKRHPY